MTINRSSKKCCINVFADVKVLSGSFIQLRSHPSLYFCRDECFRKEKEGYDAAETVDSDAAEKVDCDAAEKVDCDAAEKADSDAALKVDSDAA